jgi:hypothetical protein
MMLFQVLREQKIVFNHNYWGYCVLVRIWCLSNALNSPPGKYGRRLELKRIEVTCTRGGAVV